MPQPDDRALEKLLLSVEKPGRYVGGEYGGVPKDGLLKIALSYPDLYEIGMSNNAVKILYGILNRIDGVSCERVFAPALDLERELKRRGLSLFSLETRRPLKHFDVIAFSVGYELNATGVLQILDHGGIPLRAEERGEGQPLVIGGGPGIVNPAPFLRFFDLIYIGEAEGWVEEAFRRLVELKKNKAGRQEMLDYLETHASLVSHRKKQARRAIWTGFAGEEATVDFPVPHVKIAQDHGTIEIMRGCPNGCRFCNAGFFYRPVRWKPMPLARRQASRLVFDLGYRELSLSSLSTGDYPGVAELVAGLNADFSHIGTSFSLPSLKIDSLALGLFRQIKTVRKSGLTFAVESPCAEIQRSVNKLVPLDKTISLLLETKGLGWRQAKLYFMLGLPGYTEADESDLILECLFAIYKKTGLALHVNLATFVPKPHTPFQWCAQLEEGKARERIGYLRARLPKSRFQVSYHLPFQSFLEGLISRGDERVGALIEEAYRRGARFDAWDEHVQSDLWRSVIDQADWNAAAEVYRAKDLDEELPWRLIDLGVSRSYLRREAERAQRGELTSPCAADCSSPCGVCGKGLAVDAAAVPYDEETAINLDGRIEESRRLIQRNEIHRVLFAFRKQGSAVFLSHLNVLTVWERSFLRAGYYCRMTGGFNPKPLLEFANPLPVGFESLFEAACADLYNFESEANFIEKMNRALPSGFTVIKAKELPPWKPGQKKRSLMHAYWGSDFRVILEGAQVNPDLSEYPELEFSHSSDASGAWIFRLNGGRSANVSLRKFLSQALQTDDFLSLCRPVRLMTLAQDEKGRPVNYFKSF